jgi:hypothetical protein
VSEASAGGDEPVTGAKEENGSMIDQLDPAAEALLREVLGIGPEGERLGQNLAAYRVILEELKKLRALDLSDIHPAVVFDPTLPYRGR